MRRYLNLGQMPPVDAVRVEELINYFSYDYPIPQSTETPFSIYTEMAPSPWNKGKHLLHIGLQGFELPRNSMPASNLVFLIDVSGSMQAPNKLELVKSSLKLLTKQLSREDSIAIVTYAGSAGTVLEPVKGSDKAEIYAALDRLRAHGSTWGEGGIMAAYRLARTAFIDNGINRVVLATDGDFNVGIADVAELKKRIKRERESGIGLTTLGFGMGNYNDAMLEQLADVGNGNYAYIDNLNEARKVLVEEISSTLNTIASDVKIQIEFNPAIVSEYRLIGYENRLLKREDFNNDKVDAGEIGAGHSVTALYEIALKNSGSATIDPLRYQKDVPRSDRQNDAEIAFLKLRYKTPGETTSRLVTQTLLQEDIQPSMDNSSSDFKFAAAVSGFGQLLRASEYLTECNHASVIALAKAGQGPDRNGYRGEFIKLVELADALVLPIAQVSE
jgi:Ca-activated chloride channel family protein